MPPRIGPTRAATPATVPQMPMATPRRSGGKVRVMIAIVCGAMQDAPRPCTARATTSIASPPPGSIPERPHHRDASVNTTSPAR